MISGVRLAMILLIIFIMKIRKGRSKILQEKDALIKANFGISSGNDDKFFFFDNKEDLELLLSAFKDGIVKDFLISNGCYHSYVKNTVNYAKERTRWCSIMNIIISAFDWSETSEGHNFWLNVNSRWMKCYYEDKKTKRI